MPEETLVDRLKVCDAHAIETDKKVGFQKLLLEHHEEALLQAMPEEKAEIRVLIAERKLKLDDAIAKKK